MLFLQKNEVKITVTDIKKYKLSKITIFQNSRIKLNMSRLIFNITKYRNPSHKLPIYYSFKNLQIQSVYLYLYLTVI